MVILSARRMQKLAQRLQQLERSVEAAGGEVEDRVEREAGAWAEEWADREEELAASAARMGVELTTLRSMDRDTLEGLLSPGPGGNAGRLWAAAEILYADGLLAESAGREAEARSRWGKAAHLYRAIAPGLELPEGVPSPEGRRAEIEERLAR